jgi:hypothetical protein
MPRPFKALSILLLITVGTLAPVHAVPAPMSDQELMDKSDLVAQMRVLSVTCTTVTQDADTGEALPSYLAQLKVVEVKKGEAKPGDVVLVTWHAIPKNVAGPWTVYYYPGEEMVTHLVKRSGGVTYGSTWWNAKGDDLRSPDTRDLPTTAGETVGQTSEPVTHIPL